MYTNGANPSFQFISIFSKYVPSCKMMVSPSHDLRSASSIVAKDDVFVPSLASLPVVLNHQVFDGIELSSTESPTEQPFQEES